MRQGITLLGEFKVIQLDWFCFTHDVPLEGGLGLYFKGAELATPAGVQVEAVSMLDVIGLYKLI